MIDTNQMEAFARSCQAAANDLKPYFAREMEDCGEKFLDLVQGYIQSRGNVDTGKLLASFHKGGDGNIWEANAGALTLTVGSSVHYGNYVNEGHSQQPGRFIPGVWAGGHFRYMPGAKSGMVLKASYVKGSMFFEDAVNSFRTLFPTLMDRSCEQFIRRYFP